METKLLMNLIKEAQLNLVQNPQNYAHEITHHYRTWLTAKEIFPRVLQSPSIRTWWNLYVGGTMSSLLD
jgi:hypothetical protein